jgi:hypothetical protein
VTTISTRLRQREILDAHLTRCRGADGAFAGGAAAALHWLIAGGAGPLTGGGIATHIDFKAIVRELAVAEAFIYGPVCDGRKYARGVQHALFWAAGATSAPPVPTEGWHRNVEA